ncbi:MAG: hypothetical protein ACOVQ2_07900, partial [Flavobacterium sp.]
PTSSAIARSIIYCNSCLKYASLTIIFFLQKYKKYKELQFFYLYQTFFKKFNFILSYNFISLPK